MWLNDLQISVAEVEGKCRNGMKPGDYILMKGERLSIPEGQGFCLFALNMALPYLLSKQRKLENVDWIKLEPYFDCPEADRNVRLKIEALSTGLEVDGWDYQPPKSPLSPKA